jgi:uncharacterized protein (TIGR04222 family)
LLLAVSLALAGTAVALADEGWVIERMGIRIDIAHDGSLDVHEGLDVNFRGLSKHGIFRDIDYLFRYDASRVREYPITLRSVTSADGQPRQVTSSRAGATWRFKIGDPNRTVSGRQAYRIAYEVGGALNAFPDHDELYWNATGRWPVRIDEAVVTVRGPAGALTRADCFQGRAGSTERCEAALTPNEATFTATRPLGEGEQLTIVAALTKGAVAEPVPFLTSATSATSAPAAVAEPIQFFRITPRNVWLMGAGLLLAIAGAARLWWAKGRDRQFVSVQYLSKDTTDEPKPLFGSRPIAVAFEPPDHIRPGQMGLILDERADTLDVTATIIDLAARGYVQITELPSKGWFGKTDWQLDRLNADESGLLEYERAVMTGLFGAGSRTTLSELKNHFYKELAKAKSALYADAVSRGWFPQSPQSVRTMWGLAGGFLAAIGVAVMVMLGARKGDGLLGVPIAAAGLLLVLISGAMPRRTAKGREMLERTLGFVKYIKTAEVGQQAFAERAQIFTAYLPYAIVFRCVHRWAQAFKDIDLQQATSGWYIGARPFDASSFSSSVGGFSSSLSSALASTPGGSGGSGFGGGSSGGGGGGGGGGSW